MAEPNANEQVVAWAHQKSKETGQDSFYCRVHRRRTDTGASIQIAIFAHAKAEHFLFPELWLQPLAGGGPLYVLTLYHVSELEKGLGKVIIVQIQGPAHEVDPNILESADWKGPPELTYPAKVSQPQPQHAPYTVPSGSSVSPQHTDPSGSPQGHPLAHLVKDESDRIIRQALEEMRIKSDELTRRLQEAHEAKQKVELDMVRRDGEARVRKLEADLAEERRRQASTPSAGPTESLASVVKEAVPVLVPLVAEMVRQSREQQLALTKLQIETQQKIAEVQAQAQQRAAEVQEAWLKRMIDRPLIDPAIAELMKPDETPLKLMHQMAENMGSMSGMMLNVVSAVTEMGLLGKEEGEPHYLKALREVMQGIGKMMTVSTMPNVSSLRPKLLKAGQQKKINGASASAQASTPVAAQPQGQDQSQGQGQAQAQVLPQPPDQPKEEKGKEEEAALPEATQEALKMIASLVTSEADPELIADEIVERFPTLTPAFKACKGDFGCFFEDALDLGSWIQEEEGRGDYVLEILLHVAQKGESEGTLPPGTYQGVKQQIDQLRIQVQKAEEAAGKKEEPKLEVVRTPSAPASAPAPVG